MLDWLVNLRHARPTTVFMCGPHEFAACAFLGLVSAACCAGADEQLSNAEGGDHKSKATLSLPPTATAT